MHRSNVIAVAAFFVISLLAVLPAGAAAANMPQITHPTGTVLPVGTSITGTNIGLERIRFSNFTTTECTQLKMTGTLVKNKAGEVEETVETAAFGGCSVSTTVGNGTPWCLRSTSLMAEDQVQIRGNSCSMAARSITLEVNGCKYERSAATGPLLGTLTTDTGGGATDAILHIPGGAGSKFLPEPPCALSLEFEMSITLETDTTTSADPLYFS
jgi:hypothetical protein